ncbi:hypothetical protein A2U01_0081250, partial [Trifolium medium]|nr:hypothetical protein [Trifolium medium]
STLEGGTFVSSQPISPAFQEALAKARKEEAMKEMERDTQMRVTQPQKRQLRHTQRDRARLPRRKTNQRMVKPISNS